MDSDGQEGRRRDHRFSSVPSEVRRLVYLTSFSSVAYGYLIIAITAYLPEMGLSSGDVGLLIGVNGLVFVLSAIPIGLLSDRKGRKNIFLLGLSGIPFSILVYAFTSDLGPLLIAAAAAGVGPMAAVAGAIAMFLELEQGFGRMIHISPKAMRQAVQLLDDSK